LDEMMASTGLWFSSLRPVVDTCFNIELKHAGSLIPKLAPRNETFQLKFKNYNNK
jgi:hypothetical protein